jgi:predicted DsbA family dithiol-disulfide isomerase
MALTRFEHASDVTVRWRSHRIIADAPDSRPESGPELAAERYGISTDEACALQAGMASLAAKDGIQLHLDKYVLANTTDAQRLVHLAREYERQDQLEEVLMRAQLSDGEVLSSHETLARLADEAGLPASDVASVLESDRFLDQVEEDERKARELGVSSVPFFRINGTGYSPEDLNISQGEEGPSVEAFLQILQESWKSSALELRG